MPRMIMPTNIMHTMIMLMPNLPMENSIMFARPVVTMMSIMTMITMITIMTKTITITIIPTI